MKRSAGILLPVFSLPSPHGIGSLGEAAFAFVDFLHAAGQSWWQILPVGPAGAGNSPYSSVSTYAGSPLLIDLDALCEDGLLTCDELAAADFGGDAAAVDYAAVEQAKIPLLRRAYERGRQRDAEAVRAFTEENARWLPDYALFAAAKAHFGGAAWLDWPDAALRDREPGALARYRAELADAIDFEIYVQFLFFAQWKKLRAYAKSQGISILGDLPIYVSLDSPDVWAERPFFQLDATGHPLAVSGVPPDYFCADGQLWGNPLYNWNAMKADGYGWWIRRVDGAQKLFDAIRIDHFRAFESYWSVPAGAETAKEGKWVTGPGLDFLKALTGWFTGVQFIAEDLGSLTPAVHEVRKGAGLPGMRVLEFAFSAPDNAYLPQNYEENTICYTGTHDNDTAVGWYESAPQAERAFVEDYLGTSGAENVRRALLRMGQTSTAELFVAQVQDYLGLDSAGRINTPGTAEGNWRWRLTPGALTDELSAEVRHLTWLARRCESANH